MNVEINGQHVVVTLSRSNVRTLLHKLDWPESARTITRLCENDMFLVLCAEEDQDHYVGRERGKMHPATETHIREART